MIRPGSRGGKMISNTVITQNLYATYGDIAELTVDRLMSGDKVERYLQFEYPSQLYQESRIRHFLHHRQHGREPDGAADKPER